MTSTREGPAMIVVATDFSENASRRRVQVGDRRLLPMRRAMWIHPGVFAAVFGAALAVAACASRKAVQEQTYVAGVPFEELDAEWVRARTTVTRRGDQLVFIAPVLRLEQIVDPATAAAPREGEVGLHSLRSGYLFAEKGERGAIKCYGVFQWNLVQGRDRYASVSLQDGRALPFRTSSTGPSDQSAPSDFPIIDTLVVEVPEESLRLVPPSGLRLTIMLDNGVSFPVAPPQAYVRGFMQAVDPEAD